MRYDLTIIGLDAPGLEAARLARKRGLTAAVVAPARAAGAAHVREGPAHFVDERRLEVTGKDGPRLIESEYFVIATGTLPIRPARFPFDGRRALDSDEALRLPAAPGSAIVVGAGTWGLRTAVKLSLRGCPVTLIDADPDGERRNRDFSDYCRSTRNLSIRFGRDALAVEAAANGPVVVILDNGERLSAEVLVVAQGRLGATAGLDLPAAGVGLDDCGRLWCNEHLQTWTSHIYGAGEVVGFPSRLPDPRRQAEMIIEHALRQRGGSSPARLSPAPVRSIPARREAAVL